MRLKKTVLATLLCASILGAFAPAASAKGLPSYQPGCGETIVKSFKLAQPFQCTGTGLFVGRSGITIDLGGNYIRGDGGNSDVGISFDQTHDVTVRNGVIRQFGTGTSSGFSSRDDVVSNIVAVDNSVAAFEFIGKRHTLKGSTATGNGSGVVIQPSGHATISGNNIANNTGIGIAVQSNSNSIKKNQVAGNAFIGIWVADDDNTISGNTVAGNGHSGGGSPGIQVDGDNNTTKKNVIFGNADDGYRDTGAANSVSSNTAQGNGYLNQISNGAGTGIDASAATLPGGGKNISFGNDATAQCVSSGLCKKLKTDSEMPLMLPGCGQTISQSFRLSNNKTCPGDGYKVGASGITIDLNGFTLSGDGDVGDVGIDNAGPPHDDVTIRNGAVRGFHVGINDSGSNTFLVDLVSAVSTQTGVNLSGVGTTVQRVAPIGSALVGIGTSGATTRTTDTRSANNGIGLYLNPAASDAVVTSGTFVRNGTGIQVAMTGALVQHVSVLASGIISDTPGLRGDSSSIGNTFKKNLLVGNRGDGYFDEGGANTAIGNIALGNGYSNGNFDTQGAGIDASNEAFPGEDSHGNVVAGNDNFFEECQPAYFCD